VSAAAPTPAEARRLPFLPLLAASVLAATAGFTFSSFVLAELQGTLPLTREDARLLDLLVLTPLAGVPVLVLVLRQSGYAASVALAAIALFVGHVIAYAVRSHMDGIVTGHTFPTDDERAAVIAYGYLGWLVGPLATTGTLLALRRLRARVTGSLPNVHGAARAAWLVVGLGLAVWLWLTVGAVWAAVLGLVVVLVLVWSSSTSVASDDSARGQAGAERVWIGFGLGVMLAGVLTGSLALALVGLPLVVVALLASLIGQSTPRSG
jgi:hypothetical protein